MLPPWAAQGARLPSFLDLAWCQRAVREDVENLALGERRREEERVGDGCMPTDPQVSASGWNFPQLSLASTSICRRPNFTTVGNSRDSKTTPPPSVKCTPS